MAYDDYEDDYDADGYPLERAPRRRRGGIRPLRLLLVLAALGVFASAIWYAYHRGERVGAGQVPLVQAGQAPDKIRPQNPGGIAVPHQDKLVYDRMLPTAGNEQPQVEKLLPEPESPMPRPAVTAQAPAGQAPPPVSLPAPAQPADVPQAAPAQPVGGQQAAPQPVAPQSVAPQSVAPVPPPRPVPQQPAAQPRVTISQAAAGAPAAQQTATAVPGTPATQAVPAGKGGWYVQVASVPSQAGAAAEWKRLQARYASVLGGLGVTYAHVDIAGKGTYYRVRGGPVDPDKARAICSQLKAQNVGCFPIAP